LVKGALAALGSMIFMTLRCRRNLSWRTITSLRLPILSRTSRYCSSASSRMSRRRGVEAVARSGRVERVAVPNIRTSKAPHGRRGGRRIDVDRRPHELSCRYARARLAGGKVRYDVGKSQRLMLAPPLPYGFAHCSRSCLPRCRSSCRGAHRAEASGPAALPRPNIAGRRPSRSLRCHSRRVGSQTNHVRATR
jgi:hypothetical protein